MTSLPAPQSSLSEMEMKIAHLSLRDHNFMVQGKALKKKNPSSARWSKCKISIDMVLRKNSALVFEFKSVSGLLLKTFSKIHSPIE